VLALVAAQPASARHETLDGNPIGLFNPNAPPRVIPASEPSFVGHGWRPTLEQWRSLSAAERQEFLDDSVWRFELSIDGVPVALERSFHADRFEIAGETETTMLKVHFVQFEAGHFAPGTYDFEGRWYGDSDDDDISELEFTRTRQVTFTP
jgi:hypothetical protein